MTPQPSTWTPTRIAAALRRLWAVVVGAVMIGVLGAYGYGLTQTPTFEATSTLAFSVSQGSTAADLANGSTYAQNQMLTFAQLATSSAVLSPVITNLGLATDVGDLKKSIVVTIPQNTLILKIRVSALSGRRAADVANAIASSLTTVVREVSPKPTTGASPNIDASLVDEAVAPAFQTSPNKVREAALGGMSGLVVGLMVVMMSSLMDTRVRDEHELARVTTLPVLGSVSRTRSGAPSGPSSRPARAVSEEFRLLRSVLAHVTSPQPTHRILLTSPGRGQGTSTVAANLALALSDLGAAVLLIDADLRTGGLTTRMGMDAEEGLSTFLGGHGSWESVLRGAEGGGYSFLPSGPLPRDPGERLASTRMRVLLEGAGRAFTHVLVDSPPTRSVADAALVVPLTDDVLVVVDRSRTTRSELGRALADLDGAGGHPLGVVLNRGRAHHLLPMSARAPGHRGPTPQERIPRRPTE